MGQMAAGAQMTRTDVDLAVDGDEDAFARLVGLYHADLMHVAYVIVGDGPLAQDAVQATWTIAWRRLPSLRDPSRIRQWLLAIAVNEARQVSRRHRRFQIIEIDADLSAPLSSDPAATIGRIDLVRALGSLSAEDRALLALRYVAGLDAAELGSLTGRSASGIRARMSRLTARLRVELGDD